MMDERRVSNSQSLDTARPRASPTRDEFVPRIIMYGQGFLVDKAAPRRPTAASPRAGAGRAARAAPSALRSIPRKSLGLGGGKTESLREYLNTRTPLQPPLS
jgi:hypothetical protein